MTVASFGLDEYCARTGAALGGMATVERLEELQRAQVYVIPFENFDIQLGRGINLDPEHVFNKLVRSRRGGYCFELNGLFLRALHAAGFEARALLARVHLAAEPTGRGHQLSLVTVGGKQWIVDVGFGAACPRMPIPLEPGTETLHDGMVFRLVAHELGHMLQRRHEDDWMNLYSFDLTPVVANDIAYGNHFTSTHPSSFFTTSRIAVLPRPEGVERLFNYRSTLTSNGEHSVADLADDPSYLAELAARFGLELDADYKDLAPLPAG